MKTVAVSYSVNLTDATRRGIKHHYGLRADVTERKLTQLLRSFCRGNGVGALEDAVADCHTESGPDCICASLNGDKDDLR